MNKLRYICIFLIAGIASSCFTPPEFPVEPEIKFNDVLFKDLTNEADSLIILIDFKDGDGNLGLEKDEILAPYNDRAYFSYLPGDNKVVKYAIDTLTNSEAALYSPTLITYSDRETFAELDTLPGFIDPYNCINWQIVQDFDTVYYQANEFHHNILVDFLIQQPGGEYEEFDWTREFSYPNCGISYDGRFPLLISNGKDKPLEGTIRYGMTSVGFKALFSVKTLKLRVTVIDRALNISNQIETPPFTLQEITVN